MDYEKVVNEISAAFQVEDSEERQKLVWELVRGLKREDLIRLAQIHEERAKIHLG